VMEAPKAVAVVWVETSKVQEHGMVGERPVSYFEA